MTLEALRPVLVLRAYFERDALLACRQPLVSSDLALAWVELMSDQQMLFVSQERASRWDAEEVDWREAALTALREEDSGAFFTHEKRASWGDLEWVAMMHDDGLGSSRLLLEPELAELFPQGYWVALPDRSCGMAISRALAGEALAEVRSNVDAMYRNATTPMLPGLYDPDELRLSAV